MHTGDSPSPKTIRRAAAKAVIDGDASALEALLRDHEAVLRDQPEYARGDARSIIAAAHHFDSWTAFEAHRVDANRPGSDVAAFESAVDAICDGDLVTLKRLLGERPDLVRDRSARRHCSTLLIYVGANGVEDFRQRTPSNAVEIAETVIRAGADVDAAGTMYGGATTIGLVATSVHPERAGLQEALIDTLLAHGATIEPSLAESDARGSLINACLANGRLGAARLVAARGARLNLEGAAGIGRLDDLQRLVAASRVPGDEAIERQLRSGFNWACEYGHRGVVEYLLGLPIDFRAIHRETTGLHWAAGSAHASIVRLLLDAGFRVDVQDERWKNTPLGWAVYGWRELPPGADASPYYDVVAQLVARGAAVNPRWADEEAIRADRQMMQALRFSID